MSRTFLRYVLVASLLGACGAANAVVYDDFSGDGIDAGKWVRHGDAVHFSQSGGRLQFPCTERATERLVSTTAFAPGFFRLEFRDYYSTNASPGGRGLGSYLAIGLATGDELVRTIRGDIFRGGYFEANYFRIDADYFRNGPYELWYHNDNADSGQLGLYYDGSAVSFFYRAGLDPARSWRRLGPAITPKWPSLPKLYVAGSSGGSGCTRFSVVAVEHIPAPLPAALLLQLGR